MKKKIAELIKEREALIERRDSYSFGQWQARKGYDLRIESVENKLSEFGIVFEKPEYDEFE